MTANTGKEECLKKLEEVLTILQEGKAFELTKNATHDACLNIEIAMEIIKTDYKNTLRYI